MTPSPHCADDDVAVGRRVDDDDVAASVATSSSSCRAVSVVVKLIEAVAPFTVRTHGVVAVRGYCECSESDYKG